MKKLLLTVIALFMMLMGTAYAGLPAMEPIDATDDWYVSGTELAPSGNLFAGYVQCVEPAVPGDEFYCNQTEGCPMCVKMETGFTKSSGDEFVPQVDKPKYIEEDFGWYS